MSRIGVQPVKIEKDVTVTVNNSEVTVRGPLGTISQKIPATITVEVKGDELMVTRKSDGKQSRSDHGTIRALIANMVEGVARGYKKELELVGMGYRAMMQGQNLELHIGWTHPVVIVPPEGVTFAVEESTKIVVSGIDKQLVGLWSAKIRSVRKPEPYKGKGIRYSGEVVRRKTSKSMAQEE